MGRGRVEDTLETPEPGGAQAAPSRFPSAPSLLGTKFGAAPLREPGRGQGGQGGQGGPASRERHPGRGSHLGAERFSRQRRARGGVCPVPRPTEAVHTSAPGPERGGPGGSARPRPSAATRRARLQPAPLRTAQRYRGGAGRGGCSSGAAALGLCPAEPPSCGEGEGVPGRLRSRGVPGDVTSSIPAWAGGGTLSRAPAGDALPEGSLPAPPRGCPGPRCPHSARTSGPLRSGRGCSPAARNSRSRQSRGNLSTIRNHAGNYIPGVRSDRCKDKGAASTFRLE